MDIYFKSIAVCKEVESPENPGALERRVALVPREVGKLVELGCKVFVEQGAGEGIGISDDEYTSEGAVLQNHREIYQDKDLIIKFKGPSLESIEWMERGCTLFCMAHFASFPARAKMLEEKGIQVIAMENIVESPKKISDEILLSKTAMKHCLRQAARRIDSLNVHFLGHHSRMVGGIRRCANRHPRSVTIHPRDVNVNDINLEAGNNLVFFHSWWNQGSHNIPPAILDLKQREDCPILYDLREFEEENGAQAIKRYRETHPPFEFGLRRIQSLHETGQAGARYGLKLLKEVSALKKSASDVVVVVLGYGNVGMGAIDECYSAGVKRIHVLGRNHTMKGAIEHYLQDADLIINAAEQPRELRGINYLVTREHARSVIQDGSVVIDLIGGSASNRSAVENVVECTFLTDPHFEADGVYFSSLWGWPMMGFMEKTAHKYSAQILDVLIGDEKLISGTKEAGVAIRSAIECNPH